MSICTCDKESAGRGEQHKATCACAATRRAGDGVVRTRNPNLQNLASDTLQFLNLSTATHDFPALFGDVKFVCIGCSPVLAKAFAEHMKTELDIKLPFGTSFDNICTPCHRFTLYKAGPVLSVSYGLGLSSINVLLHEIIKLVCYAKCKNPIFFRIGSSGGLGIEPGTLVISESVCDATNRDTHEITVLGYAVRRPAKLDQKISARLRKFGHPDDKFKIVSGKTMCAYDYYEEHSRLDGAVCEYSERDKLEYLNRLKNQGVVNMEMEGLPFAALTYQCGIQAAMICVCMMDRLKSDKIEVSDEEREEFHWRPRLLIGRYIKKYFEKLREKRERELSNLV